MMGGCRIDINVNVDVRVLVTVSEPGILSYYYLVPNEL
jgi:hypothetical protein